jgi:hypothetical protein
MQLVFSAISLQGKKNQINRQSKLRKKNHRTAFGLSVN